MKGTDITHNYSVGGASLNATPVAGYSVLDNSFKNDLSVEFVGNRVFSTRSVRSASSVSYRDNAVGSVSYSGGQVMTTRLSNKTWRSYSSGSGSGHAVSGSFVNVHSQIEAGMQTVNLDFSPTTYAAEESSGSGRPTGGATGELNPDFASPVGDVLLPLLLMAFVYTVVRFWRNRKLLLKSK